MLQDVGHAIDNRLQYADENANGARTIAILRGKPFSDVGEGLQVFEADGHNDLRCKQKAKRRASNHLALPEDRRHAEIKRAVLDMEAARAFDFDQLLAPGNLQT